MDIEFLGESGNIVPVKGAFVTYPVFDCFPYYCEKELLRFRYELYKDLVDAHFVLEADRTQSGAYKGFHALEHIQELGLDQDRIQVIHIEVPEGERGVGDNWVRERGQRDALSVALEALPEPTIVIQSDCDEFLDPDKLPFLINEARKHEVVHPAMNLHYVRADYLVVDAINNEPIEWYGPTLSRNLGFKKYGTYSQMRNCPPADRLHTYADVTFGHHFCWTGGKEARTYKLKSMALQYKDQEEALKNIEEFSLDTMKEMLEPQNQTILSYDVNLLPGAITGNKQMMQYLLSD